MDAILVVLVSILAGSMMGALTGLVLWLCKANWNVYRQERGR